MMHLDNFEVEVRPQHLGCLSGEPKQGVHPGGEIGRPHDGNLRLKFQHRRPVIGGMAGRADHQRFFVLGAKLSRRAGDFVKTEVDHHIRLLDHPGQVVANIDSGDDLDVGIGLAAAEQRLAHPPLGPVDDDFGHGAYFLSTPQALSVLAS